MQAPIPLPPAPRLLRRATATILLPALAMSAATLAGAPTATARPTWLPARTLATNDPDLGAGVGFPRVTVGPDGTATAVWVSWPNDRADIESSSHAPGQSWSATRTLSSITVHVDTPGLAAAPDGTVLAAWSTGSVSTPTIQTALRDPSGTWHPAETVPSSVPGAASSTPDIDVDGRGQATVAWPLHSLQGPFVAVSTRPPGATWGSGETVATPEPPGIDVRIGVAADGTATIVWLSPDGDVMTSTRAPGGTWDTPERLDGNGDQPRIAVAPNGAVTATWRTFVGYRGQVRVATRPPGGSWAPVRTLGDEYGVNDIAVAADDRAATVAWAMYDENGNASVQSATRTNGSWGDREPVAPHVLWAGRVNAAASGDGDTLVSWHGFTYNGQFAAVRRRVAGRGWGRTHTLVTDADAALNSDVAFSPAGDGMVVWYEDVSTAEFTRQQRIRTTTLDVSGPILENLTVPATGTVGKPVPVSVDPIDVWSALGTTEWDFGDGTVATGTHATHTYADPGTYIITIVSRDEHGNRTTKTRRITITGPALPEPAPDPGPEELPSPDPNYPPQDCDARFISITRLQARGTTRRPTVRLGAESARSLSGQTLRVLRRTPDARGRFRRERTVGTATVRPDGTVVATVRAPVDRRTRARTRYRLATATVSSGSHYATRRARFTRRQQLADGRVRVEGRVTGIRRPTRLTLTGLRICGGAERTYGTVRSNRNGRFRTTLTPPSGTSSITIYRVRLRMRTFTLPTVVHGR